MSWYSWVPNPEQPYATLTEAFNNWRIVENNVEYTTDTDTDTDTETQDFIVSGDYDNKWGQQNFLIQQLAPVLDDTVIHVMGEDHTQYHWAVENHTYRTWSEQADEDEDEGGMMMRRRRRMSKTKLIEFIMKQIYFERITKSSRTCEN